MRLAWAFFHRDASVALSYRIAFLMQFVGNLGVVALLYFVGKTLGPRGLPELALYGGSFLAYALIGVALADCVFISLASFATQIREAQTTGTLEATLICPVSLSTILIYSSLWNYFLSAVRFTFYLTVGVLVFGVHLGQADLFAALTIFLLTVLSFMGVGILWAAVVLLVKRGESLMMVAGYVVVISTGIFFPVSMLPPWLQKVSAIIPLTPALDAMRSALLNGSSIVQLAPLLLKMVGFAVVLMSVGILGFTAAVNLARKTGSLTQY
jgi:ABC-2 type transport system permease protein